MSDMQDSLRELYQEVIFDHNRNPRNYRPLPVASHHADGHNPLCGDQLTVYLQVEDGIVREASFVGQANGLWLWQNDIGQMIVDQLLDAQAQAVA